MIDLNSWKTFFQVLATKNEECALRGEEESKILDIMGCFYDGGSKAASQTVPFLEGKAQKLCRKKVKDKSRRKRSVQDVQRGEKRG